MDKRTQKNNKQNVLVHHIQMNFLVSKYIRKTINFFLQEILWRYGIWLVIKDIS